jgi:hypothetical protein
MGGAVSKISRIGFEELQQKLPQSVLINTLPIHEQDVLIRGTMTAQQEVSKVEFALQHKMPIIIYGKNARDASVYTKYEQLLTIGHTQVFIYPGGLFEWMLLQDIYGKDAFPTTSTCLDLLKFR